MDMARYGVLRHPANPEQTWSNAWKPDNRLVDAIMTNRDVAPLCEASQRAEEYVYVYRCAWGADTSEITSRARVKSVTKIGTDFLISFSEPEPVAAIPRVKPSQGQDFYFDSPT